MRFIIKHAGSGSERVGYLTGFLKSPSVMIETPTAALLTQSGSVVHLTAEVLSKVFKNPQLLWVPLSNSAQLEIGLKTQGEGVAKFAGLSEHITCTTLHNAAEKTPQGHFEGNLVPLWTKNGKKMISTERYMDLMELFKPDILLAIADSRTTSADTMKRNTRAVERSCRFLEDCINRYKDSKELRNSALIGVITGTGYEKKCYEGVKHMLRYKEYLSGVSLAGITNGSEESLKIPIEKMEEIFGTVGELIPKDLLRFVEGCWNPEVIMTAIQHGWDIFDGTYPTKLTNAGYALALSFDVGKDVDELCVLDLNDERYKDDFRPIKEGCECLACKKHTRAYIRHLLNTREMLSTVLLSIHNLHHFDQMFVHSRQHIVANTFNVYKDYIIQQYKLYKQHEQTVEETKMDISEQDTEKANKKICVSNGINPKVENGDVPHVVSCSNHIKTVPKISVRVDSM